MSWRHSVCKSPRYALALNMHHSTVPWIQVDLADLAHLEHLEAPEQITLKIVKKKKQKMKKINAKKAVEHLLMTTPN